MIDNGLYLDKPITRHTQVTGVVVPAAGTVQVTGASAKRVRLHFAGDGASIINLGQQNPVDGLRAIRLGTGHPQIILDKDEVGSMIQSAWFASSGGVATNLSIIETDGD